MTADTIEAASDKTHHVLYCLQALVLSGLAVNQIRCHQTCSADLACWSPAGSRRVPLNCSSLFQITAETTSGGLTPHRSPWPGGRRPWHLVGVTAWLQPASCGGGSMIFTPERTRNVILATEGADKHHPVDRECRERGANAACPFNQRDFPGIGGFQQPVSARGRRPSASAGLRLRPQFPSGMMPLVRLVSPFCRANRTTQWVVL